jgi:hypothetical protein
VDLYNTVTASFIARNVSSSAEINLSPKSAAVIICVPANGKISYEKNKMLLNNIIVDYNLQRKM